MVTIVGKKDAALLHHWMCIHFCQTKTTMQQNRSISRSCLANKSGSMCCLLIIWSHHSLPLCPHSHALNHHKLSQSLKGKKKTSMRLLHKPPPHFWQLHRLGAFKWHVCNNWNAFRSICGPLNRVQQDQCLISTGSTAYPCPRCRRTSCQSQIKFTGRIKDQNRWSAAASSSSDIRHQIPKYRF